MATQIYLAITDGTATSCLFGDGSGGSTNFKLVDESWAPAVAGVRLDQFGGRGPYTDVVEDMAIDVTGSTAIHCLNNVSQLQNLMNQADRWYRGENVSAVQIWYSPPGGSVSSAASPLKAVILGRVAGDDSALTFSPTFQQDSKNAFVANARLRFRRRGAWLHNSYSGSASGANGAVVTVAATSSPFMAPTNIVTSNVAMGISSIYGLCISDSPSGLSVVNPDALTNTYYTTVAKTYGTGGSVLQFAPGSAAEYPSGSTAISLRSGCRTIGAMLNVAASPSSITYTIRLRYYGASSVYPFGYSNKVVYTPQSGGSAEWISLGQTSLSQTPGVLRIYVEPTATGGSLWIDSLVLTDLTDSSTYQYNYIIDPSSGLKVAGSVSNNYTPLTSVAPSATMTDGTSYFMVSALGDHSVSTSAGSVYCLLLANDVNNSQGYRQGGSAGSSNTWTITRPAAYLTPV